MAGNPDTDLTRAATSASPDRARRRWRPLHDLRLTLGFFTVLPLSRGGALGEVGAAGYLLPVVALLLGTAEGLAGWGSLAVFGPYVAAALVLTAALLFTGFHHADGLADLGDALMAHGDRARRLEVLKDRSMGMGAAGALLLTCLISWAALLQIFSLTGASIAVLWVLIAAEAAARLSLLLVAVASSPSHPGSGSAFMAAVRGWRGLAAIIAAIAVLAALAAPLGLALPLLAGAGAVAVSLQLVVISRKVFGGANGDVLGAAVELGRAGALLGLAAALSL